MLQIIHADWSRACHVAKRCTPNGYWPNRRPLLLRTKLCIETAVETVGNSPADMQFWISDDVTKKGLWARQTRINIHTVFAALMF